MVREYGGIFGGMVESEGSQLEIVHHLELWSSDLKIVMAPCKAETLA